MALPPYAPWQRVAAGEDQGPDPDGFVVEHDPGVAAAYLHLEDVARLYRWARRVLGLGALEVDGYELWQLAAEAGLGGMRAEEEDLLEQVRERAEREANGGRVRPEARQGMRGGDVEAEALRMLEERNAVAEREVVMFPVPVPEDARPAPVAPTPGTAPRVPFRPSGGRDLIAERIAAVRGGAPAPLPEPSGHRLMDLWGMRPPPGAEGTDGGPPD